MHNLNNFASFRKQVGAVHVLAHKPFIDIYDLMIVGLHAALCKFEKNHSDCPAKFALQISINI